MILSAPEGMGGWLRLLTEWLLIAKRHGLTLVEPCVRDGAIVPCALAAPPSDQLPLSAYLDVPFLRHTVSVLPFRLFCDAFQQLPPAQRSLEVRFFAHSPGSVNASGLDPAVAGNATCARVSRWPWKYETTDIPQDFAQAIATVRSRVLVLFEPFRHKYHKQLQILVHTRVRLIRFAPLLHQRADTFIREHLGSNYAALQWRVGALPPEALPQCLQRLEDRTRAFQQRNFSALLLLTDLPSPATGGMPLWDLRGPGHNSSDR